MKDVSVLNQSSREGTPFASISKMLTNKLNQNETVVCVVGLGYVGLPLAKNFSFKKKPLLKKQKEGENAARVLEVIGFDIDNEKIEGLKKV